MDDQEALPSCSIRNLYRPLATQTKSNPLPVNTSPSSFTIRGKRIDAPLVTVDKLKGHLALLRAFASLRSTVEGSTDLGLLQVADKERRWAWFVGLAVERFDRWCHALTANDILDFIRNRLPPVDVIMVWHAYLLNPGWNAEDVMRIPALKTLGKLSNVLASSLPYLREILSAEPSSERVQSWFSMTSTPFDPLEAVTQLTHKQLICPACRASISAPFITAKGTGYSQTNFTLTCTNPRCKSKITKATLAIMKFAQDAVRNDGSDYSFFPGTLLTPTNSRDIARATTTKTAIMKSRQLVPPKGPTKGSKLSGMDWEQHIQKEIGSLIRIRAIAGGKMWGGGGRLLGRMLTAYTDDRVFSVELVGAVLRQGSFVTKMHNLGWTESAFFDRADDAVALQHCIARYHAFLDLIATSPGFFVPTLDIDLAWHTHQLMAGQYSSDCKNFVGRFVDHDDKVEENQLATSFDLTCRVWKDRFGVQYTHCGCPLPGETIGQKLSRLVGTYRQNTFLVPLEREEYLAATHPSDHNAIFAFHRRHKSEKLQKQRRAKMEKRQKRDVKQLQKGKDAELAQRSGRAHDAAFLVPVPLHFGTGGCAAMSGGVIDSGPGVGGCAAVAGGGAARGSGGCSGGGGGAGCGSGGANCGASCAGGGCGNCGSSCGGSW